MKPKLPNGQDLRKKETQIKQRQKQNFDLRNKASDLKPLKEGDEVWLPDRKEKETIVKPQGTRSYMIQSKNHSMYRRNRKMILPMPSQKKSNVETPKANSNKNDNSKNKNNMTTVSFQSESTQPEQEQVQSEQVPEPVTVKQTRSGRISKPPDRLVETDD